MAKTLQELQSAISDMQAAVDADVAQDEQVVSAIRTLIDKIKASPNAADFEAEVLALESAKNKLSSDNANVQASLDEAGTV